MRIAVYCGSRGGDDPKYMESARLLGTRIGERGHTLVYGAGFLGIMGAVSTAVQRSGGHIIGVIPQFMVDLGWERKDLSLICGEDLPAVEAAWQETAANPAGNPAGEPVPGDVMIVTSSMSTRKARMMELADVYIALPGGPGTLEEITEVISLAAVHQHEKPCILLNQDGYYEPLRLMYEQMRTKEFMDEGNLVRIYFAADVDEIVRIVDSVR